MLIRKEGTNIIMKRLILICLALVAFALAACAAPPAEEQAVTEGDGPVVTVYHPPT